MGDYKKVRGIKERIGDRVDPGHKGCLHTMLFRVVCGVVAIFILFALYNIIVRTDNAPATLMEQEEEEAQRALLDTFDVVGDYFLPGQKADMEDLLTDADRDAAEKGGGKDAEASETTGPSSSESPSASDDIIESADISSDASPAPVPGQNPTVPPTVEKIETPAVTPIE